MKKKRIVLLLLVIFIGAGLLMSLGVVWYALYQPLQTTPVEESSFVIPKGQGVNRIGERLSEAGLIHHPLFFRLAVLRYGLADRIQAGTFTLSPNQTASEIAVALTQSPEDQWVTVLEGWRLEEVATEFLNSGLTEFDEQQFIDLATSDEGYLFPDTYLVPKEISTEAVYNLLLRTFDQKVINNDRLDLESSDYSIKEVIILASLLEREARGADEMRHVAGILNNRLAIGMPLQLDATLQYAKGYNSVLDSWWTPPTSQDKALVSPYNTYLNPGLPPTPIASPGLEAIEAVLNPLETDDYYYLHSNDGNIYYAQTLEQHNSNVRQHLQ